MFAGLISKEQPVSAWGDATKILAALAPYSLDKPRDYWATDKQMLLQVATRTGSTTADIYRHQESGVSVAFWGRLDNRPDLIAQLVAEHKASDDELIALAWLKWGEHCPEKLIGDFAFAVASPKTGVVFLARDVIGVKPLYYCADDNGVFFANTSAAFKPLRLGRITPSREWIARFVHGISYSHSDTAYEEIKKLPAAHSLLIQSDGRLNVRRYHEFIDDAPVERTRDPKYLEAYRAAWQEAVACRLPTSGNIGTENSGGIDSGSITSEVARQLGNDVSRLSCFGFCLEEQEPSLIMATAMKFGIPWTHLSATNYNDLPLSNTRTIMVNGYPVEHRTATDHSRFYEICCSNAIGTLYSGFGGDEVVTNEGGGILFELLDGRDYANLFKMMRGSLFKRVYRGSKMVVKGYAQPRVNPGELQVYRDRWQYSPVSDQVDKEFGIRDAYLAQADWGSELRRINSEALCRINRPYVQNRVENGTLLAASYGIDYVWPLLDSRLMQQWLSTPSIWKVGDRRFGRYLHRKAIEGVCPNEVTWKIDKDMGFGPVHRHFSERSNLQYFEALLAMSKEIYGPLTSAIDVEKIRRIASDGLTSDPHGYEVYSALDQITNKISSMIDWMKHENNSIEI